MNAPDPHFAARIRESFGRQKAMALIGASLARVEAGEVEIALPWRDDLTQQKGFVHGGVIGMIADTACGYAAYSLMPADSSLVTVEYKINILAAGGAVGCIDIDETCLPQGVAILCEAAVQGLAKA